MKKYLLISLFLITSLAQAQIYSSVPNLKINSEPLTAADTTSVELLARVKDGADAGKVVKIPYGKLNIPAATSDLDNDVPFATTSQVDLRVPYTGATQQINLNTQGALLEGGELRKNKDVLDIRNLNNTVSSSHYFKLTDVASFSQANVSTSGDIIITLPIRTSTSWTAEIDIQRGTVSQSFAKIIISAYGTTNLNRKVSLLSGHGWITDVKFGRDASNNTVLIIKRSTGTSDFSYGKVNLSTFYHSVTWHADLAVKSNYKVEFISEGSLSGFTLTATVNEAAFEKNPYYAPISSPGLLGMPTAPTAPAGTNTTQIATTEFVNREKGPFELYKSGTNYKVRYPFNDTKDIVTTFSTTLDDNGAFNFVDSWLIDKTSAITATTLQLHGTGNDDIAPVNVNGVYIGANHGAPQLRIITATAHGKTVNDVGSIWNDGSNDYILLKVVDANNLWFFPENRHSDDTDWDFPNMSGNTLTHVSGAINTGNINSTTKTASQLRPAMKNVSHNFYADGKLITTDGAYRCSELKIYETYDINDVGSMLELLVSNQPVGGYLTQPDLLQGDVLMTIKNTYEAVKGGFVIYSDMIPRKACNFNFYGIVQSRYMQPGWITKYKRYVPHTTTVNDGSTDWDFRLAPSILTPYATSFNFTEGLWESGIAPVRSVDIAEGSSGPINFNMGYLPIGVSKDRENVVNNSLFLHTTRKNYPNLVTGDKINDTDPTEVSPNQVFSGAAYRIYTEPQEDETNSLFVKYSDNDDYGYLTGDFHDTGYYRLNVPDNLIGKKITVLNKSAGVTILGNILQGTLDISVSSLTNGYAYFEIKADSENIPTWEQTLNASANISTSFTSNISSENAFQFSTQADRGFLRVARTAANTLPQAAIGLDDGTGAFKSGYAVYQDINQIVGATQTNNDIEITDTTKGIILTAPDGGKWRITVDNTGNIITTDITP